MQIYCLTAKAMKKKKLSKVTMYFYSQYYNIPEISHILGKGILFLLSKVFFGSTVFLLLLCLKKIRVGIVIQRMPVAWKLMSSYQKVFLYIRVSHQWNLLQFDTILNNLELHSKSVV